MTSPKIEAGPEVVVVPGMVPGEPSLPSLVENNLAPLPNNLPFNPEQAVPRWGPVPVPVPLDHMGVPMHASPIMVLSHGHEDMMRPGIHPPPREFQVYSQSD